MSDYEIVEVGSPAEWRGHHGGFDEARARQGRRVVDHELTMQYIGLTANALAPGEQAGYWHEHAKVEELYVFLDGQGEMGLDDEVVPVGPGTFIRVGQGVARTWRAVPEGTEPLTWVCIRAGGTELEHFPSDASRLPEKPMPWSD